MPVRGRTRALATPRVLIAVLCLLGGACQASHPTPIALPAPPPAAPTSPAQSTNPAAAALPNDIRWVQRSAEYHAAILQAYRAATARIEQQAPARSAGSWGVILDADETVISNVQYQIERVGQGYSAESWAAWVHRREATPLPGASAFLARVHELGGRIAIVTNRLDSECADTIALFRTHALTFDAMLCRPDKGPSDKNPRFEAVAAGKSAASSTPLDVIAFVGDNILDFPKLTQAVRQGDPTGYSEFGLRFFLLPNPMYGSWEAR
jgi:5'-nucleotidase (lipoprotein e(P4) family)